MSTLFVDTINEKTTNNGVEIPGHIINIQSVNFTGTQTSTSSSFTDITNLSISITPKSSSSKFLLSCCIAASSDSYFNFCRFVRNGTAIHLPDGSASFTRSTSSFSFSSNIIGSSAYQMLFLSAQHLDSPNTASRPFDRDRDGFVLGEGGGALILEEYEHAKKRGAKIYAEIIGFGMSCDAHHITAPHPEGEGARIVMENAIKSAEIKSNEVDYINVHGTSTPLGDKSEIMAIENVFGDEAKELNISSTKSMTGHLLGAAGAIESIASIVSINESFIPPTINHSNYDDEINKNLNLTLNKYQDREVNIAISNTFGFGGHNTSIVFKKYEQ